MKTVFTFLVCACACFVLLQNSAVAQSDEKLFQEGVRLEEVKGNLEEAIEIYRNVVEKYPANQSLAAKSLLRMGRCYEKLGKDEAKKVYERITKEYASQTDVVTEARARLAALTTTATAGGAPVARMLLSSFDSTHRQIVNPNLMVPSPDGRRVAYFQSGSEESGVYVRDLATGEVQQVATGRPTADNYSVVWSAEGRRLAFRQVDMKTRVGAIKIHDLTSGETVAVPGLDASKLYILDWSHDGRYLLCNHERNTLELVTIKDGTMTTLSDSIWYGQRASFSPDSRFVTFARGKYGSESAYTQPVAGGPRHRVADTEGGVYLHPLWSPDGRAIAYQHPDGIWVVPVADGVASGKPRLAYRTDIPRWPVTWTETGGLYFTLHVDRRVPYQVAIDPATAQPGDARTQELAHYPQGLQSFHWSPDTQRVAFTRWSNNITIYAADTKAMTTYDLGAGQNFGEPAWWSEDGREVLFHSGSVSTGKSFLRAIDPVSGQTRDLFPPIEGYFFSLSADGNKMAFARRDAKAGSFEVIVAATGHPDGRVVATAPGPDGLTLSSSAPPRLSPLGNQVLFVLQKAGTRASVLVPDAAALWVVGSDGTGARRLAKAPFIISAMWDPSGRFIAYTGKAMGTTNTVLRVIEVATGAERDISFSLPNSQRRLSITDWSRDGRVIGIVRWDNWWEYWVVKGLQEGVR